MRLATWNINSVRARIGRIIAALDTHDIDVLAMQEVKCRADQFPHAAFAEAGYDVALWSENQWNGVAIASRVGLSDVTRGFPQQPLFRDVLEPRAIGATCGGVRVWSLYVPHGRSLTDAHMTYKLQWLAQMQQACATWLAADPELPLAVVGDFNVAPYDEDVWDMAAFVDATHVSAPERAAFFAFTEAGLSEVTREHTSGYTYWDYRQLRFVKNEGMRIDYVYASPALARRVRDAQIIRAERKGKGASDHVPVVVTID